ncbi:SDR family NAD(P)-dependent oxidoreductase [Rhizobium sp. GN54]|uniref:SDR family NAD(P)-dependent oxidoreductase n=1 Tax=Rhizobium sp. GN54 TaxID=2898150 RepID=UPI001E2926C7|nr:SDR family NAD(P)-dependent oxidoreductase [Rhizobium sp. GN54]MCD2184765.1 SDR family oxidoreductase [Rhizobium sp. GN54]
MSPLKEHVIIVTGAARGIGKTIAETVARQGGHVIVTDILTDGAEAVAAGITASGGSATAFTLDITRPEDAEAVAGKILERFGRIDGLVNNAALDAPHGRAWEIGTAEWRHVIEVDLNGAWYCSRAVIPAMRTQRRGRIVFISSIAARLGSPHLSPAYSTAKAGLIGLTVSLSAQLESDGILVNAITPGPTGNTGAAYSEAGRKAYLDAHPLGFGGPEPIANAVAFLLGPGSGWTSGAVMNVSGGHFRGI